MTANVIGAGLAGCEAAWQLAKCGILVSLFDMKPEKMSPAHKSKNYSELVCSNSLRSGELTTGAGLLKQELREMGSLIIECADQCAVPAGGALAVDRESFSALVTAKIKSCPNIVTVQKELQSIPDEEYTIVATGPLTMGALVDDIKERLNSEAYLSFFDAAAPIVTYESVDLSKAYFKSRYDKGTADYINCPMNKEEYLLFREALCIAEEAEIHGFEDRSVFEGCLPIEVLARRGVDTMRFGPLKPKGLRHPETGVEPYAVVQLRKDNAAGTIYNLVGFQTHLKFSEQKRVFSMIGGLENAEFVRFGVMHRNTYINSPKLLNRFYELRNEDKIVFAGQITGVEGYIESTASGLYAGLNLARRLLGEKRLDLSPRTATGALSYYISESVTENFQPMNINFGIIETLPERIRGKRERYQKISERALLEVKAAFCGL